MLTYLETRKHLKFPFYFRTENLYEEIIYKTKGLFDVAVYVSVC